MHITGDLVLYSDILIFISTVVSTMHSLRELYLVYEMKRREICNNVRSNSGSSLPILSQEVIQIQISTTATFISR